MGFGIEDNSSNLKQIYDNYVKTHPGCKMLKPDVIWLKLKENGQITQEQYNTAKSGLLFHIKFQTQERDWKSIIGLDPMSTPAKPQNYVENFAPHKYAKELLADAKGYIYLNQFNLKNLKEKYNSKLYNITSEKNNFGVEIITIRSRKDNHNSIQITKNAYGEIIFEKKNTNSEIAYFINKSGELHRYRKGKDNQNHTERCFSHGKIASEAILKNGEIVESKYYENGKLKRHDFYGKPEGDYRLDYKNGQIVRKYMLSGKDKDVYYIYENGKPIKKMFATTNQCWAKEGDTDTLVEDYRRTERINKITEELRKDIYAKNKFGLPTTRPTLSKHVMSIKPDEVEDIMSKYQQITGENLLDAIENEIGMNNAEKTRIHNHLEKLYIDNGDRWETGKYIGKKLTKYSGIASISGQEFARYIKLINPQNVIGVLRAYDRPELFGKDMTRALKDVNITVDNYSTLFDYKGLIQNIKIKWGLNTNQRKELIKHVLTQLDKSADDNSDFIYVKDIVKSIRKNLANGDSLYKDSQRLQIRAVNSITGGSKTTKANGKFDSDFKQGNTGDCWLISGIISVVKKPEGKKALESCLKVDAQGNVTVNMKGAGKVYKISAKEIAETVHLSEGDGDVRAIEIAMDRYIKENSLLKPSIDGNRTSTFYNAFFGNGHSLSYSEDFNNPKKFHALSITFDFNAIDNEGQEVEVSGKHEIAIVGSDKDYVHVLDPNKGTDKPLRITWAKFRAMYAQLNNMDVCEIP